MYEKIVRKELFLIEGDNGFEDMTLRGKMNEVIRMSCNELQENFYELGINNELPNNWVDFKNYVVEFCTNQSIYSFKKFIDERWSGYLKRLRDWVCQKNIKEEVVLRKLRLERIPNNMQAIFYSPGVTLENAIERVQDSEYFEDSQN